MTTILAAVVLLATQLSSPAVAPPDSLGEAKRLYSVGAYEDALGQLSGSVQRTPEADQYRALCLLALGRTQEAGRSLEDLIGRDPFFKMSVADVSPRLVTMFQDARRRLLPASVKRLYSAARQAYDDGRYREASGQFKDLLALLADGDLEEDAAAVGDLKILSEGFVKLADAGLKAVAAAVVPPPAPPTAGLASQVPQGPRTYSSDDHDAVPPVPVNRVFPTWTPKTAVERHGQYQGILHIVITASGSVESATLIRPVFPTYDPVLLEAARGWRFRPATVDGQAVRYQLTIPVSLGASSGR